MRLREYLDREKTGQAFVDLVINLRTEYKDKAVPLPVLRRRAYDCVKKYGGDTEGMEVPSCITNLT